MIQYLKEITLDFSGGVSGQRIVAKQGDKKSRFLKINPILNGQQLVIDADCTIDFRCTKPDKTSVRAKCTLDSDGKITVELPEQALAVTGDVQSDIAIIGNQGEILSSSEFIIEVRATPTDTGQYIPSEDYFKRESDIDMNNHQLKNLSAPQDAQDAATKQYVDTELDGKLDNTAGSVKSANLADGCVAWNHIGDGQVTTPAMALNSIYARHIVDGNVTKEKLSTDLQTAIDTIGAVKVDRLNVDTASDGLYVTKEIYSETEGYVPYTESGSFFVFVSSPTASTKHIIIASSKKGFFNYTNGYVQSVFSSTIEADNINAPTTEAVYNAIQEALGGNSSASDGILIKDTTNTIDYIAKLRLIDGKPVIEYAEI